MRVVLGEDCSLLRSLLLVGIELHLGDQGSVVAIALVIKVAELGDDELTEGLVVRQTVQQSAESLDEIEELERAL